ncbi:MAG: hypothetical protein V7632_995 [Bradyrhizobium sp.]
MRVLMVSTLDLSSRDVGKKVVMGGFCDYFRERVGAGDFKVVEFAAPGHGGMDGETPRLALPGTLAKLANIVYHSLIRGHKSFQESCFWSGAAAHELQRIVREFKPDLTLFDTVRSGQYRAGLLGAEGRSVLYLDDLFSLRYQRVLAAMQRHPGAAIDPIGNFKNNLPSALLFFYKALRTLRKFVLRCEQRLIARSEVSVARGFDLNLLLNQNEVDLLAQREASLRVAAINPCVGCGEPPASPRRWHGRPEFVFLGSLNLVHNAFSIESFVEQCVPALVQAIPGFTLRIVGRHASERLQALARRWPQAVRLEGYVEDLDEVLATCAGMLVPVLFGSGVKIKIIDALRAGVPIVSTRQGIDGVKLLAGEGVLVEDDPARFVESCKSLLDPAANCRSSEGARSIYRSEYAKASVFAQYDALFGLEALRPAPAASAAPRPTLSIVIPNFNYQEFIGQAIESALAIDWPDVQVIVVDDGSTDGSRAVIGAYADRVTVLHQPNQGQVVAYNTGFAVARGEVVIFLDSDDLLDRCVMREINKVWRGGISKVQFRMRTIDAAGRPIGTLIPQFHGVPSPQDIRKWATTTTAYPTPPGSGNAYSRQLLGQIFPLDDSCGRPGDACCLAAAPFLGDVVTIPAPMGSYRIHGRNDGAVSKIDRQQLVLHVVRAQQRHRYAQRIAMRMGLAIRDDAIDSSLGYLPYRLASLRMASDLHPLQGDRAAKVVLAATRAVFAPQGVAWAGRLALWTWTLLASVLPTRSAQRLILWRFAPATRPVVLRAGLRRLGILR